MTRPAKVDDVRTQTLSSAKITPEVGMAIPVATAVVERAVEYDVCVSVSAVTFARSYVPLLLSVMR